MRLLLLAAALAVSACATAPAPTASSCPAERAVYHLRGEPRATMRLLRTTHPLNAYSELAARVDFEGETYWFAFTSSLGYSRNYIGRTEDPFEQARREDSGQDANQEHREPDYDGSELTLFDHRFNVIEGVPDRGNPAPAHMLANGVGAAIWYSVPRRSLPKAMWDFTECANDVP